MTDDFAVLDFIVVEASVPSVAQALAQVLPAAKTALTEPSKAKEKKGLMSRLMGKAGADRGKSGMLSVHPPTTLKMVPFARTQFGPSKGDDPRLRLSGPVEPSGLTLIEFCEPEIGQSSVAMALSTALPQVEVFYFRYSGARHPGADYAFHIYQDGRVVRRAASISFRGTTPEAQWTATDKGMPHPFETDSLPAPEAPPFDVMTPERQASILAAMGIEPDTLFTDVMDRAMCIVLSTASGGRPVEDLSDAAPKPPSPTQSVPAGAPTAQAPPHGDLAQPSEEAPQPPYQGQGQDPVASEQDVASGEDERTPMIPSSPMTPDEWESRVTTLLLEAVEAGLPEDEQVPWLDALTEKLESGAIEEALETALRLIDKGDRPIAERVAAANRLKSLYAHLVAF